jgi:hypothetical protein
MNQINKLAQALSEIGFIIEIGDSALQIVGLKESESNKSLANLDFEKVAHVLQIVIEFDDPTLENQKYLFQGCSLKVYFEDWDLQEAAKIIKFNIANILNENGIFRGMNFEFSKTHEEVIVP